MMTRSKSIVMAAGGRAKCRKLEAQIKADEEMARLLAIEEEIIARNKEVNERLRKNMFEMEKLNESIDGKENKSGLLLSSSLLQSIVDVLKRRFGRPDLIVRTMVQEAKMLPSVKMVVLKVFNCPQLIREMMKKPPYGMQLQWGEQIVRNDGKNEEYIFTLFDEASKVALIDEDLTNEIGLEGKETNLNLKWTDEDSKRTMNSRKVKFEIAGEDNKFYSLSNKTDRELLPQSENMAIRRLSHIERKMKNNKDFTEKCSNKITEYQDKGYAKLVPESESEEENRKVWYLTLFDVIKDNKPGKMRFVFDAASKSRGKSLNAFLLKGPDLYNSLIGIIWKFREWYFTFSRNEETGKTETYAMQVIFGAVCSPSSAQYVKNRNALEYQKEYPRAVDGILNRHHMDDYLDSVDTKEEAVKLINEVITIQAKDTFKGELEIEELQAAEKLWCSKVQRKCLEKEIQDLKNKKNVNENSKLNQFSPTDKDGLTCMKGRTDTSPELREETKGQPKIIWSDSGTNLRSAGKKLRENLQKFKEDKFKQEFIGKEIEWRFTLPASAHIGKPGHEVLLTLLMEAKHIANSCPLTYVPSHAGDSESLTFNNFFIETNSI
ncbi:hypothetical protein ILUMI_24832 [Ignelater luminosus]|uniref:Uncharacterized protein n=1 Tax=Ignelater luminosus TaxID=2038154 RepID=A0A8K0C6E0_IGNLU|nr:hypothetical protein ILUMI_24832 [Ignelater luminosus]